MDVIRSRQLAEDKTMVESFKDGKLWRGFGICAVRAVLVNSVGFYVYDYMKENSSIRGLVCDHWKRLEYINSKSLEDKKTLCLIHSN